MHRMRGMAAGVALFVAQLAQAQSLPEMFRPDPKWPGGFVDLNLRIDSSDCPTLDKCTVVAKALHRGTQVGLEVHVERRGARQLAIHYRSLGESSDRLLLAMAELYKVPIRAKRFRKDVRADLIVLRMRDDVIEGKVFFEFGRRGYAELYTNIDKRNGVLEINKKDEEYRASLLKAFSE